MAAASESQLWPGGRASADNPARAMQPLNRTNLKG